MKKIEYRCSRCLIIEVRWTIDTEQSTCSTPCHKCGGLAIRLPIEKWKHKVFEEFTKEE